MPSRKWLFILAAVSAVMGLMAQSITSSLIGTVTDSSGAVVPNATIIATNVATNARGQAKTDSYGNYLLLQLSPGSYTVEVSAQGFKRNLHSAIVLELQQQAQLDVKLEIGQVSDTVTVSADASALETTTSTIGQVVNNRAIMNLPLNTRNVYSLIYLTPGVSGSIGNDYNSLTYSINGTRVSSSGGFMENMVDGVPGGHPTVQGYTGVAVFPSVDAIAEFKVDTQNYSAEFGRSLGNVVNLIYKSGTNLWHGSAYEFLRNSYLDANTFFSNAKGVPLSSLKRSQFGGVVNGPIRKNKTFFMFALEDLRQSSFSSTTTTVPTAPQRQGDFSQTLASNGKLIQVFNPFSTRANPAGGYMRDPFPGNVVPTSMINPVSANVEKYYPLSNTTGTAVTNANNYYQTGSATNNIDNWDLRVDHNLTDTQKFFARYSNRTNESVPATLWPTSQAIGEGLITQKDYMRNAVAAYTNTLSPTTVFDARLGFARTLFLYQNGGLGFAPSSLGFPKAMDTADLALFPTIAASGYATLGATDNRHNAFMTYSALTSLTKVVGSHNIKIGWDFRLLRVNDHESSSGSGNFSFGTNFTQGPNPSTASSTAGNGLASLLLGTGTGSLTQNFKDDAAQSYYFAWFVQDDWRVSRKLTLNLGLRYDLDTPRTDRYNRMNYFDRTVPSPLASQVGIPNLQGGLVFVGVNGVGRTQYDWELHKVAPRFGFAYQANNNTVIRGGWAVIYGPSPQEATGTVGPYGFRVQNTWVSSLDGITPYSAFSNPFPQGFQPPPGSTQGLLTGTGGTIEGALPNTVTPYAIQWNLNIQRALPGNVTLQAGYVGNRGLQLQRNQETGFDLDQVNPQYLSLGSHLNDLVANPFYGYVNNGVLAASQVSRMQLLRPYPQFTNVYPIYSSGGVSNFESLQTRFGKRFSHGLQFEGSYTWSKVLDNQCCSHQNSYDISQDWAVTNYDITHRFVVGYIYELPFGRGRHFGDHMPGAVNWVLGGWQINGITTIQSGTPLSISASNVAGIGTAAEWANSNGQSPVLRGDVHNRLNQYFNTSVFSQPAAFTLGNVSPYVSNLRTPYQNSSDLSCFKEFFPRDNIRVQFRAEFFNAFNRVQFSGPTTSVTSTSFGVISSQANSPRQLQFGLKILF
jgi:outer membrane receptor protein involved in Fe transport